MHQDGLHSGTVPASGLQYSCSPSLPTAMKAMSRGRDASSALRVASPTAFHHSTNPTAGGDAHDALPQSTLDLYERYHASLPGTEPTHRDCAHRSSRSVGGGGAAPTAWSASLTLPDALSSIGPSARRLLQLDTVLRHDAERQANTAATALAEQAGVEKGGSRAVAAQMGVWGSLTNTSGRTRASAIPAAARTLPLYADKPKAAANTSSSLSRHAQGPRTAGHKSSGRALPAAGAAARTTAPALQPAQLPPKSAQPRPTKVEVRPPLLSSTIMNGSLRATPTMQQPSKSVAPPLVNDLHRYIRRELIRSTTSGGMAPSALDQLGPYREAFRALSSAFPAYASLMSDIQSAYDNVVQAQAELLTDAYAAVTVSDVERMTNQELVGSLHDQMNAVQAELKRMETTLTSRALADEEVQEQTVRQRPRSAQVSDVIELRRELDVSHQRIGDLERSSRSDLEKIVVLIGAVRECDRRLKEYECIVAGVTGQVSELDEFKRIAGEAQAELQGFRKKYASYVPITDFQLMKDHLTAELETTQMQTRRWRRTAAARGAQLDVMQRRLANLEEERTQLLRAVDDGETSSSSHHPARLLLTPRPSWSKLHRELPELAEHAANVGLLTAVEDHQEDMPMTAVGGGNTAGAASPSGGETMPTVKGMKETALQVDYLVQRVRSLKEQLKAEQLQSQQMLQVVQKASLQVGETCSTTRFGSVPLSPLVGLDGAGKADGATGKTRGEAAVAGALRRTSRRGQFRSSDGFQTSPNMCHPSSSIVVGGGVVSVAPPLELPLIGPGFGPEVPPYLRASGVLTRRPVAPSTVVALIFHFFLDVLPPYMDAQDQPQRKEDDTRPLSSRSVGSARGGGGTGGSAIGTCFFEYLQSEMMSCDDLRSYTSVAHLVMNLMKDGEGCAWFTDALHVLLWTVQGVLPPRVAVDAAVVVAQVKRDLRALAKEMQSSRLRRLTLGECLQPVLELKSPAEVAELRAALGNETTFSVDALCSDAHPFMEVLLVQECRSSAGLYLNFVCALSGRATAMVSREISAGAKGVGMRSAPPAAPPTPQLEKGDRVLTLADVAAAIQEVEPLTPEVVVRELSVNAAAAAGGAPASPSAAAVAGTNGGALDGTGGTDGRRAASVEGGNVVVRLSDILRAIGAAPLIRRTAQSAPENFVL